MGRIFERFGNLRFHNEAEVSDKFVVPLFIEFLGYGADEILSERLQPAVKILRNREIEVDGDDAKIKPDFMVALDGDDKRLVFSFDTKGPNESLDSHLSQLRAYCISAGTNLIATTNGTEFRVYNANDLVFRAANIEAFDLQFPELRKLIHKDATHLSVTKRIHFLDDDIALGRSTDAIENEKRRYIAVRNSDFNPYLHSIVDSPSKLTLPPAILEAFQVQPKHFPAQELYTFLHLKPELDLKPNEPCTYNHIIRGARNSSMLIVGESGIGKTSLLIQIACEYAEACLRWDSDQIPVLVRLGDYTSSNNLRVLISNRLRGGGTAISELEVTDLLQQGRLILLLDAFDEVIDIYLHDLQREIENLLRDFGCLVIMTSRHFRLPQLSLPAKYEMQPLIPQKIHSFSEMYLGAAHLDFTKEIIHKDLGNVASNTLLLTLLILLYLSNQDLPHSQTQVISAVLKQIENWSRSKPKRFQQPLPWQIKLNILSELAFLSFTQGESYTLDAEKADGVLVRILNNLVASRKVSPGMQVSDAYDQLADTGLIHLQDGSVSFWHRAFQEYLASFQIGERVQSGQIQINNVIKLPKWESVLPSIVHQVKHPDALIGDLLSHNVFAAGRAIIERDLRSGAVYEMTVECLKRRCESQQRAIREIAVNLLRRIEGNYVGEKFRELLESEQQKENCEFEHIRKIALVEIARRKIPNSRDIVYAHLDWRSYTRMDWISQEVHAGAAVIEALSWFDDQESQQHIVDRWIKSIDFPTREACRDALIRIADRGSLDSNIKQTLIDSVSRSSQNNQPSLDVVPVNGAEKVGVDYWGLEAVLIAIHDVDMALKLIPVLGEAVDRDLRNLCILQILKTFNEPEIIESFVQQINLHRNNPLQCERFLDVLSEIEGEIPIEVLWDFAQDELPTRAKACAISGLANFSFDKIKATILSAIHPPSYEKLVEITNDYLINQALQTHRDTEVIQAITDLANLPNLADSSRKYLHQLLAQANDATGLLRQMATTDVSEDVRWSIIVNCQHLSPKMLQLVIPHLLSPLPEEYLLINDSPCSYARVQEKVFQVLEKHGQIALLAKAENRPKFLYNISSEVLFDAIRRDKIYEMEPFVLSFIDRQTGVHQIHVRRMVVEAAWVLADLGNTEKAQDVISQVAESIDLSVSGSEWILGDILKGIHLLPSDYALHQIEKTWSSIQASDSVLSAHQCVEALEQIGTPEALDMLARIAQEAVGQPRYILVPERALRAIQKVSPAGREDWLIRFLQQNDQDRGVVLRVIDMLGMTGNRQVLPMLQQYFENPPNERIRYFAFWAIHNIYKATNEVWYNSEESGCV